jgi:hypothetical protein
MIQRSLARVLLPIIVIFFVLGFLSVLVQEPPPQPDTSSISTPLVVDPERQVPSLEPEGTILLVLGVDSFESSDPHLLAIWWVQFSSIDRQVALLGLPTDASLDNPETSSANEDFNFDPANGPSTEFLIGLSEISSQVPDIILVMDEHAFANLIDFMGGAWLEGSNYDGWSIISALQFVQDDPDMALALQASLLVSLSFQIEQLGNSPEITPLMDLVPSHAYISIPPTTLVNLVIPLLPINADNVQIHLWTPESHLPDSTN